MGKTFKNQIALVTGASSGIGKAIAQSLKKEGAKLIVVGRNHEALKKTFKNAYIMQTDLSVEEEITELKKTFENKVKHIDILIHSAGIYESNLLQDAPLTDFDELYKINVRAPYQLTQALIPMLKESKGQIVFINSSVGLKSKSNLSQYAATKHALKAVADSLRDEVNEAGVRVLSIYLGSVATPMQEKIYKNLEKPYEPEKLLQPQDVADTILCSLSLPRTAEVTEISIRPMKKS